MVKSAQVTVGTSETLLESEGSQIAGDCVFIRNTHATSSVFLGPHGVTTGTGFELKAGITIGPFALNEGDPPLYGVASTGTARVDVLAV